jgi:lipopolysaccharide/colanic/teichoic acid biosynthesis glycosyltransferase
MDLRSRRIFLDLGVGTLLLILTLPLVILLAVGSALSLRAWPLFTQERLGRCGRSFKFMKIRSLPVTAPRYASKYELGGVSCGRYGKFIRTTHLDELPQLFLVVMGKMSLVGPRPEMAAVAETFDPVFVEERLRTRPGCTGLWQVSTASQGLIGEAPQYDRYYAENCNVRLDLWVLWRTAVQLFPGVEAISLEDVPAWTRSRVQRSTTVAGRRSRVMRVASEPAD